MPVIGWETTHRVRMHECRKPWATRLRLGRLWECPVCSSQWVVQGFGGFDLDHWWGGPKLDRQSEVEDVFDRNALGVWRLTEHRRRVLRIESGKSATPTQRKSWKQRLWKM